MRRRRIAPPDPNVVPTTLGERIRTMRTAWGWSQNMLADAICVDQATVSFWELDRIRPSGTGLLAVATLFRTIPEALETGQGFVTTEITTHQESAPGSLRAIGLPVIPPSGTMTVDVMSGRTGNQDLTGMIVALTEAVKTGRRLWVVVE